MKTLIRRAFLVVLAFSAATALAPAALAQRSGVDWFIGYANLQAEGLPDRNTTTPGPFETDFFLERTTLHGVNTSITGHPTDYFGITADFSFDRRERRETLANGEDRFRTDIYYLLAGPTVSIRNPTRVEPFFRAMAGAAHTRFDVASNRTTPAPIESSFEANSTDFAAAVGGGIDIRIAENLKLRLVQVDWVPVFLRDRSVDVLGAGGVIQPQTLEGQRQDHVRFAIGLVF